MNLLKDDHDTDVEFKINENYARNYNKWRQGEELQKLKDKYGNGSDSEESTSEEEDEDAIELTQDVERDFFKTLSSLKEKNPKIYDKNTMFFKDACDKPDINTKKKKEKFYSVGEYQRNALLKNGGQFNEAEENDKDFDKMTNVEQEKALKNGFKDIINDTDSENEGNEWGTLFKKRIKTQEELKTEEADYKLWLAGEKEKLQNKQEEKDLKGLHDYWTDPTLDEGERFLRDYILNKRFLDKNEKNRISYYDEIVHDSDSGLSADEQMLEKQEEFERKYNFRFEEPDHEFVKRYPRTLQQSMRKKDERRKKHREDLKARKETERKRKAEELKRLKALKKKEIMDRIKKLQEITGNEEMGFQSKDLEGDFNPEEYDKRMSEIFNANYYDSCADKERPEYPELDQELEVENWDEWNGESHEELHCEDPGFNMDCDYEANTQNIVQKDSVKTSGKGNKRRRSKFAAAVAREKPVFNPADKTFEKYVDEYYALDYEDLIGDLPCRFKYRKVIPNDFGLTVEEILAAPDKELNNWVSLKKIMQRRPENKELFDIQAYKARAQNLSKKKKFLPSLYKTEEENIDACANASDDKKNHKNNFPQAEMHSKSAKSDIKFKRSDSIFKCKSQEPINNLKKRQKDSNSSSFKSFQLQKHKKEPFSKVTKKKEQFSEFERRKNVEKEEASVLGISDARLESYGINPKKLKNKLKYGSKKTTSKDST